MNTLLNSGKLSVGGSTGELSLPNLKSESRIAKRTENPNEQIQTETGFRFEIGEPARWRTELKGLRVMIGWIMVASALSLLPGFSIAGDATAAERAMTERAAELFRTNEPSIASSPASPSAVLQGSMEALDDKHRLAIGDRLSFRILEDQEDPAEPREPRPLFVTDSGELEVPYIGRVPAEEKTCKQLAYEIKKALEADYYHRATVLLAIDIMAPNRGKVYLVGQVRIPGPLEIPSDEVFTLSKAIVRAGGFSDFADKRKVKVTRRSNGDVATTLVVNVGEILEGGKLDRDIRLEAGDLILVPERAIRF